MLTLGHSFNRNYSLRLPFMNGFYDIQIFFNTKSSFLLFGINSDFTQSKELKHSNKINMFKNIESSKFVETFLNLHNYRSKSLDIINQFKEIKPDYTTDIHFIFNDTITLSKVIFESSTFYDMLLLYCFTITSLSNEFIFLIAERQNIISKLSKKVVRSNAIQISTKPALDLIDEYFEESKHSKILDVSKRFVNNEIIKIEN